MSQGTAAAHEDAVPWIDLEMELRRETPRQWAARFRAAGPNQVNKLLIILSRFATNTQIARLFHIFERQQGNHKESLRHWHATLTRLSPTIFSERTRYKTLISEGDKYWLFHYKRVNSSPGQIKQRPGRAIIGLTGSAGMLMAPISCILAALADTPYDLILIRRKQNESYFDNNSQLLRLIKKHLRSELKDRLRDSILFGTSSGGLAALCMAHALRLHLGIAIGARANPDTFRRNGPFTNATQSLQRPTWTMPWERQKTELYLAASAENQPDKDSALLISDYVNNQYRSSAHATSLLFPNCSSHNLLRELSLNGISLDHFLLPVIDQTLNGFTALQRHPQKA